MRAGTHAVQLAPRTRSELSAAAAIGRGDRGPVHRMLRHGPVRAPRAQVRDPSRCEDRSVRVAPEHLIQLVLFFHPSMTRFGTAAIAVRWFRN